MPIKLTRDNFIKRAKIVQKDKYDYSRVIYAHSKKNVIIVCPIHGYFLQTPNNHLKGQNCPKCGERLRRLNRTDTIEQFIVKAKKIHNNKYNYSKAFYKNCDTKVIIICPIHGEFFQAPNAHLNGQGCPKCGKKSMALKESLTKKEFVIRARKTHENKYNYDKVIYINCRTNVTIICPIHGKFNQTPDAHVNQKQGCPLCKMSCGEKFIISILNFNKLIFIYQKTFQDCINPKTNRKLLYDFYLPEHNMLIEYNGIQHYHHNIFFHRPKHTLEDQQHCDSIKQQYALSHGYRFLVIKYTDNIEEALQIVLVT